MPPRYAYWTILAGGLPTAFRAAERDDLLPTFQRIREKHPDAEMKWFARGKLWASPEEAQQARDKQRAGYDTRPRGSRPRTGEHGQGDRRPAGSTERRPAAREGEGARGRDWRPGGEHRDPRQKFKDAKKDRNLRWRKERFEHKQGGHGSSRGPQAEGGPRAKQEDWRARPPREEWKNRPPREDWRDRAPREKPHGDKLRPKAFAPRPEKPRGPARQEWRDRPREDWRNRPPREEQRHDRPREEWKNRPPREDWRNRPPREKPHGDKLLDRRNAKGEGGPANRDHGWRRDRPADQRGSTRRPFERKEFDRNRPKASGRPDRERWRGQGPEEPQAPPRPKGPNREPRRGEEPPPTPPRPAEPSEPPSGPPERGGWKRDGHGRPPARKPGGGGPGRGNWKPRGRR